MANPKQLIQEISHSLVSEPQTQLVQDGRLRSVVEIVAERLPLSDLSERMINDIGAEKVGTFYDGLQPCEVDTSFHIVGLLLNLVPRHVSISKDGNIQLSVESLETDVSTIYESVSAGTVEYSVTLRLANVDIARPFQLSETVLLKKSTPEEIATRYPIDRQHFGVAQYAEENWQHHCVEAEFKRRGKPADIQNERGVNQTEVFVNSVVHAFLFANSSVGVPNITHVNFQSPIETSTHLQNMHVSWSAPRMMTDDDVEYLKHAFDFLDRVTADKVLEVSTDRFLIAKKRSSHHPHRINSPNWDKLVDYVIAMETLFLTTNGSSAGHELSYRFRLNGAALLQHCTHNTKLELFHALKHLYTLRSKVVHGCDESATMKAAGQLLATLGNRDDVNSPIQMFGKIVRIVEGWLRSALIHVDEMENNDRPYRKKDGWEALLWGELARESNAETELKDKESK